MVIIKNDQITVLIQVSKEEYFILLVIAITDNSQYTYNVAEDDSVPYNLEIGKAVV